MKRLPERLPDDTRLFGFGERFGKHAKSAQAALAELRRKDDAVVLVVGDHAAFTKLLAEFGATPAEIERVLEAKLKKDA